MLVRVFTALFLAVAPAAAGDTPRLENPSFEEPGDEPAGWARGPGARNGMPRVGSEIVIDRKIARRGKASLRVSGNAATTDWPALQQEIPVVAGDRVIARSAARWRGVTRQKNQYFNAQMNMLFFDVGGRRLSFHATPKLTGDGEWTELVVHAIAPEGAVTATVALFLSMTGTVWFDDVRISVAPTAPFDAKVRGEGFDALLDHLGRSYPFWGLPGKPQPEELQADRAAAVAAVDPKAYTKALVKTLARLNDMHVTVVTPNGRLPTVTGAPDPINWNYNVILGAFTEKILVENDLIVGRIDLPAKKRNFGVVVIGTLRIGDAAFARLEAALEKVADCDGLLLDLRPNGGGSEPQGARIAARFADKERVYGKSLFRSAGRGFFRGRDRRFGPRLDKKPYLKPIIVLQGPYCVSSAESFLLMMRTLPHVTTVGLPTRGASGNPRPFRVVPGIDAWCSTWRNLTPDGKCIEGVGVPPDERVEAPLEKYGRSDPTYDRGVEILMGKLAG